MSTAYVASSCLVAIAFGEPGAASLSRRLNSFDELVSSSFLEAEIRSAFKRERIPFEVRVLSDISLLIPDRLLTEEIERVFEVGYVCGADCWHIANALYLAPSGDIAFITLDEPQRKAARQLGFTV